MSLNSIMSTAVSGMGVAQTGLSTVSDNIANVNTPGYVRKIVEQSSSVTNGIGTGVMVAQIRRAADSYLQSASLTASSTAGKSGAVADLLDQAQSLFGDPSSATNYFNQLNDVFNAFGAAANDPASSLTRAQTLDKVTTFLDSTQRIASGMQAVSQQADTRITSDVQQINQLLSQIDALNTDITRSQASGGDATGSLDAQSQLIDKLSTLMDVKVQARTNGGVVLRTDTGVPLAGEGGPATLDYLPSSGGPGQVTITQFGATASQTLNVSSGELRGLLDVRNVQLPAVQDQLGEFVSKTVDAINAAHNASSAVPPPTTLNGRNTGLDLPTAISGFTGKTSIAVVDASGQLQQRVDIDFTAGTMTVNGAAGPSFTSANFLTQLNTALGGAATASFNNGALTIGAASSANGVSIQDDATTPSSKAGRGFSQFFGLNDLLTSGSITNYATGLQSTDASGFPAGQTLALRITDANGQLVRDVSITTPGGTVGQLVAALNAQSGGVGQYGQFTLDSQGSLAFSASTPGAFSISVLNDQTQRSGSGPSMSQLFGLGAAQRASRTGTFQIRADIAQNPAYLALAQLNLGAAAGQPVLALGDNSGALQLAKAGDASMSFAAAGDFAASTASVTQYASQFGGALGRKAASADDAKTAAEAVKTEADNRRQSAEGVNLDEELVNLTTYQQAYSASARLIQAAKDMYDTLLAMATN